MHKPKLTYRIVQKVAPLLEEWNRRQFTGSPKKENGRLVDDVARYLRSQKTERDSIDYKFATGSSSVNIFSITCAYLTKSLCGIPTSKNERDKLIEYLLKLQREDGLFFEDALLTADSETLDHFGPRHLSLMLIPLFGYLDFEPRLPMVNFTGRLGEAYIDRPDFAAQVDFANPVMTSNYFMNVGGILQFARDFQGSSAAKIALNELKEFALKNVFQPESGLFWVGGVGTPEERESAIRSDYHYRTIFCYDGDLPKNNQREMVNLVAAQQNDRGGFGAMKMPDACADVDSVYLLVTSDELNANAQAALRKAVPWIQSHQHSSGGFQFRKFKIDRFGGVFDCEEGPYSASQKGTWFRLLSLALLERVASDPDFFQFSSMPGYQHDRGISIGGVNL